jgi:hypothetical protein
MQHETIFKTRSQAFVGWEGGLRAPVYTDEWYDETLAFGIFFGAWMNGYSLDDCIDMAESEYPFARYGDYTIHLDWPLGTKFPPGADPVKYSNKCEIQIMGYAGLMRNGYEANHDNSPHYFQPQ